MLWVSQYKARTGTYVTSRWSFRLGITEHLFIVQSIYLLYRASIYCTEHLFIGVSRLREEKYNWQRTIKLTVNIICLLLFNSNSVYPTAHVYSRRNTKYRKKYIWEDDGRKRSEYSRLEQDCKTKSTVKNSSKSYLYWESRVGLTINYC